MYLKKIFGINRIFKKLEKQNNIKILFAVENGSRAWKIESADSDYDVRFVFVRHVDDYLGITEKDEVLQYTSEDKQLDMVGFDIKKFVTLLSNSNPTTIEWLTSDIIYYGKRDKELVNVAKNKFNVAKLYFHYKSLCRGNYEKYIKSNSDITYKRYICTLRGLINAKFVAENGTLPPIDFNECLRQTNIIWLSNDVYSKIKDVLIKKKHSYEKHDIGRIPLFDGFIESFLADKVEDSYFRKSAFFASNFNLNRTLIKIIKRQK